ncbi:Pre-mRNA-processing protein [Actinidia chinensis var. chinensis]|uniref:Pre-mRNA-processing protein n=1 Tax=Actinidia chinensis var. chinensis TaxID=1590841 RepID=A0A2R6Q8Q4_ACTCC|nr:Pre-mRNA-processing protein [Actinidia chinensis var. chinensis]
MPLKANNLGDALAPHKSKAVHSPTIQDHILVQVPAPIPAPTSVELSLLSFLHPKKDKGKALDVGLSCKQKPGVGWGSVGTSTLTDAPELLNLEFAIT